MFAIRQSAQSARWPLLWMGLLAVLVFMVCVAAFVQAREDAERAGRESGRVLGMIVAHTLERDIALIDAHLSAVGRTLARRERLGVAADDDEDLFELGRGVAAHAPPTFVLDARGALHAGSRAGLPIGEDFSRRDYFTVHRDSADVGLFIGQPFFSPVSRSWVIAISRRLETADGLFAGVVGGVLHVSYIETLFRNLQAGEAASVILLRTDGVAMARYPDVPGLVGKDVSSVEPVQRALATPVGSFAAMGLDGIPRLYSHMRIAELPLIVKVGLADNTIHAAWQSKAWLIGAMTLLLCGVTTILVYLFRRELELRVAAERTARRNETRYRLLAENSADTIVMSDADGRIGYVSPAVTDVLGWSPRDIEGRGIADFVHHEYLADLENEEFEADNARTVTFPARHRNESWVWLEARVRRLPAEIEDARFIANVRDVSRRKKAVEELEAANAQLMTMAATDGLTGLANRRAFDERLAMEWRRAQRDDTELALLLIDVDYFKSLNDHYGHQRGDRYLHAIANLIAGNIRRPGDMVARYGGEEFAVLLPQTGVDGAVQIAEKVRCAVADARIAHDKSVEGLITVSVGVHAMYPAAGGSMDALIRCADAALYAAKRAGRNCTQHYRKRDVDSLLAP